MAFKATILELNHLKSKYRGKKSGEERKERRKEKNLKTEPSDTRVRIAQRKLSSQRQPEKCQGTQ